MLINNLDKKEIRGDIIVPGYYDLASLAAYHHDSKDAYNYLDKAWNNCERGNFFMFFLMNDPFWDDLRGEEQFQNILKKYQEERIEKKQFLARKLTAYQERNELKWLEAVN